jgi:hypothetical protein
MRDRDRRSKRNIRRERSEKRRVGDEQKTSVNQNYAHLKLVLICVKSRVLVLLYTADLVRG